MISVNDLPNKSYTLGNMYAYDYEVHKWIYDCKYYLIDNNWCMDLAGKDIVRATREPELKMIEQHQNIIDNHERENAAWSAHKRCRKRNCICKKSN